MEKVRGISGQEYPMTEIHYLSTMRILRFVPKRFRRKRRGLSRIAFVIRKRLPLRRIKQTAPIILTTAAHGAVLAGLRKAAAGAGVRCVARYAARGALVGAMGGAVPVLFTGWAMASEVGVLVRTIGESRILKDVC